MNVRTHHRRAAGFTLVELAIVMLIIGIMVTFLLVASYEGVQRSYERATQGLILKLDTALSDRVDALTTITPPITVFHRRLAQVVTPGFLPIESEDRAAVIARLDYVRSEMPDVFFIQDDVLYPINCGGQHQPTLPNPAFYADPFVYYNFSIPLGTTLRLGDVNQSRGMFGASYPAMAGFTRQIARAMEVELGRRLNDPTRMARLSLERWTNGIDDGNASNLTPLIDEFSVEELGLTGDTALFDVALQVRNELLLRHRHETARSEALFAMMVSGQGPLGSYFSVEDFKASEIGDTDQDGLLEFLDAWGRPLQFFRWPVYYVSDAEPGRRSFQRGAGPYYDITEVRDQNTIDPNQQLMAPAWWADLGLLSSGAPPTTSALMSLRARYVHQHFVGLVEPAADDLPPPPPPNGTFWDRSSFYKRRAFFSKFLVTSGGADLKHGIGLFDVDYADYGGGRVFVPPVVPLDERTIAAFQLTAIESQAGRYDPVGRSSSVQLGQMGSANAGAAVLPGPPNYPRGLYQSLEPTSGVVNTGLLRDWGADDITNQNLGSVGTGGR